VKVEDQKGHSDGEYAVAERGEAFYVLAGELVVVAHWLAVHCLFQEIPAFAGMTVWGGNGTVWLNRDADT
jgi:hypothetical protein